LAERSFSICGPAGEPFAQALRQESFVHEVKIIDNKLLVNLDNPEIHNPEIVRILVNAGADIQFVGELRHSLEDVYLTLVKGV
jgi:ABC-2 type transport system ATP-binding protein